MIFHQDAFLFRYELSRSLFAHGRGPSAGTKKQLYFLPLRKKTDHGVKGRISEAFRFLASRHPEITALKKLLLLSFSILSVAAFLSTAIFSAASFVRPPSE
jgi:hypothetical protein